MKRDLSEELALWSIHPLRKPLVLRGARQVGKSWLVKEFGKQFDTFIEINFEKNKSAKDLFLGDINIDRLLEQLSLFTDKKITPGKSLLFLDEIQECEAALLSLRYFKEELPELHVIAAGSLIDFTLEKIGMPVGRVQFLYLHPLSFGEFLTAMNYEELRNHIKQKQIENTIHAKILTLLKTYLWLGGMPAVVSAWKEHKEVQFCLDTQSEIITAYEQDFHKYAKKNLITYVEKVFRSTPHQLGSKFKFVNVDNETRSIVLKSALSLLEKAGIIYFCYHTSGQQQPLGAAKDEKKFKVYFFDVGLAQRLLGNTEKEWLLNPLVIKNIGPIAEQFVAQEIVAYSYTKSNAELYYWHREARSSNAEVDFVVTRYSDIIPIEVKSGANGRMKSLQLFLESHINSPYGAKISENRFSNHSNIHEIPLYGIEAWLKPR